MTTRKHRDGSLARHAERDDRLHSSLLRSMMSDVMIDEVSCRGAGGVER
jgi:hypothetical protein